MKILLTGGNGMLGRTLRHQWQDFDVVSTDLPDADITNAAGIDKIISGIKPDAVVHCAAMTAVDKCERRTRSGFRSRGALQHNFHPDFHADSRR